MDGKYVQKQLIHLNQTERSLSPTHIEAVMHTSVTVLPSVGM